MTDQKVLHELSRVGNALYESRLKPLVEPNYDGQYIAIHIDSEDYAVGKSTASAIRSLKARHPTDGRIYLRKIGEEPEFSLAARLDSRELVADRPS